MLKKLLFLLLFAFSIGSSTGCSTTSKDPAIAPPAMTDSEYFKLIKENSQDAEKYNGFHNLYKLELTFLNTKVQSAVIDRLRYFKQLDVEDSQKLREKAYQEMSTETQFFISYYSPQKALRHLDRGEALWKVYLEHNGRKFEAQIDKYPGIKFESKQLFPNYTRWSKGYLLRFKVPTSVTENDDVKIIMASSAGKAVFEFKANQ